jgi:hypothetical protein
MVALAINLAWVTIHCLIQYLLSVAETVAVEQVAQVAAHTLVQVTDKPLVKETTAVLVLVHHHMSAAVVVALVALVVLQVVTVVTAEADLHLL